MSIYAQFCLAFWAVYLSALLVARVRERRRKRREDDQWVTDLINRHHQELRKRFRDGRFRPRESYGKFIVQKNDN